jgi:bis(5'-nucleosidyl)-tetraphosphatase
MIEERSAGAIIFKIENKKPYYLLLKGKYKSEYWEFPKGLIEKDEEPKQTALREIKEETGLEDIELIDGYNEKVTYFYRKGKEIVHKEVILLLAKAKNENVKISYEHANYKWADFEEARKLLRENLRRALEKAHKFILERFLTQRNLLDFSAPSGI